MPSGPLCGHSVRFQARQRFGDAAVMHVHVLAPGAYAAAAPDLEAPAAARAERRLEAQRLQAEPVLVREPAQRLQRVAPRAENAVEAVERVAVDLVRLREAQPFHVEGEAAQRLRAPQETVVGRLAAPSPAALRAAARRARRPCAPSRCAAPARAQRRARRRSAAAPACACCRSCRRRAACRLRRRTRTRPAPRESRRSPRGRCAAAASACRATWRAATLRISSPCSRAAMRRNCQTTSASPQRAMARAAVDAVARDQAVQVVAVRARRRGAAKGAPCTASSP